VEEEELAAEQGSSLGPEQAVRDQLVRLAQMIDRGVSADSDSTSPS
jgi:hypothetical protein